MHRWWIASPRNVALIVTRKGVASRAEVYDMVLESLWRNISPMSSAPVV